MDASRFEDLLRALSGLPSRRGVTCALAVSALSAPLASFLTLSDAEAKRKKKRKNKKKKTRKATCSDGRKNGSESDVDCGGSCFRCANGKTCAGRDDCRSAFCANGTCQSCADVAQCGSDEFGPCACEPIVGGISACNSVRPIVFKPTCAECPAGMNCLNFGTSAGCIDPCGAPQGRPSA